MPLPSHHRFRIDLAAVVPASGDVNATRAWMLATSRRLRTTGLGLSLLLAVLIGGALAGGCSRDVYTVNEANPYYQEGVSLRQGGHFAEAAQAFEKCVFYSPESFKAHLQLAVLYDDHLGDLPRALTHYKLCLASSNIDASVRAQAESSLRRAEERLYQDLAVHYGPTDASTPRRSMRPVEPGDTPAIGSTRTAPATDPNGSVGTTPPPAGMALTRPTPEYQGPSLGQSGNGASRPTPGVPGIPSPSANATPPAAGGTSNGGGPIVDSEGRKLLGYHTVASGDSLSSIAKTYYGKSHRWTLIFQANRDTLSAPEKLKVGQKLRIPATDNP